MPVRRAEIKRSDEKLLRVLVDVEGDRLRSLELSGDFFIHPEEGVEILQQCLSGLPLEESALAAEINKCLAENGIVLVGLSPGTIAAAISGAR